MSADKSQAEFDVFLSHSSVDKPWVIRLKEDLKCYGVSAWLDRDEIQPGTSFVQALEEALEKCKAVALVVTPEAINSPWVREEYNLAVSRSAARGIPMIPVLLRDAKMPGFLENRDWVDFRDRTKYSESVWELVWGITGQRPSEVIALPAPEDLSLPDVQSTLASSGETPENAVLWRLAYAFLRLEQLPSGGWARSLPKWYQMLKGDTEEGRSRGYELRKIGGMNLTCLALVNYTRALCSVLGKKPEAILKVQENPADLRQILHDLDQVERRNGVAQRAIGYIEGRINIEGAIPDQWERNPDTDVHHTLLGITVLLLAYFLSARRCRPSFYKSLVVMCRYLDKYGRHVKLRPDGRRYEIYCAIVFLRHLLEYNFFKTEDPDVGKALAGLPEILNDIRAQVCADGIASTYPDVEKNASAFLLNLPFLWNLSGSDLLETNPNFTVEPLSDIGTGADGLVQCTLGGRIVDPDWGHTAEYWWAKMRCEELAMDSTQRSLQTLVTQLDKQHAFSLTHGVSFSYVLGICNPPTLRALQELDQQVNDALKFGATERNVLALILWIYRQEYPNVHLLQKKLDQDRETLESFRLGDELYPTINKLKNLFVNKLQPGSYIPSKGQEELYKAWQEEIKKASADTRHFFEHDLSDHNTTANEQRLRSKKWFHLFNYLEEEAVEPGSWVLDVGCGSGAHALHQFLPKGYRVHFYDYSDHILEQLKVRLDAEKWTQDKYRLTQEHIERLPALCEARSSELKIPYRIIFADGVLFHISKELMPKILSCFYDMLSTGGLFFANFKVNDHTLIGIDGRRFEYYASHDEIQRMIEDAGFRVDEVTITTKTTSMYNSPYPTQWAHYISSKR